MIVPNPNLGGVLPLKPWPPNSQGPRKLVDVDDAKTPLLFWPTHLLPIDFALSPRDFIFGRPKEGSLKLIDGLQGTERYFKM
jgi:hypothetical protein